MKVIIYGRPNCTFCVQAKQLAESNGMTVDYKTVGEDILKEDLERLVGKPIRSVPQIFVTSDGFSEYVGGFTEFKNRLEYT